MNAGVSLPVYHRIRGYLVSKTMYTATEQIYECHKIYTGTQGSVYLSTTESMYTATQQICQYHKFDTGVQVSTPPTNQRIIGLYVKVLCYARNLPIS